MEKTNKIEDDNNEKLEKMYIKRDLIALVKKILIIVIFIFIVTKFIFTFHINVGDSMTPNIKNTDLTLVYKMDHEYNRGDVVLISKNGTSYILRIIGTPENTILFSDEGDVIINNERYDEDYIYEKTYVEDNTNTYPLKLNENEYFVLGDNRTTSKDSRDFGIVTKEEIKGKVIYVFRNREI